MSIHGEGLIDWFNRPMADPRQPRDQRGRFMKSRAPAVMDDIAIVILNLDRKSGFVRVDAEFATPAEAWAACARGQEVCWDWMEAIQFGDRDYGDGD